ncbi:tyrosine-type recombinase/integrase [Rhodobacteraceae bacterium NNCM2]|nr:tyrosine-type recombinase/integrase [Coraliihabitans acroporae]
MKYKRQFPGASSYIDVRGKRRWRFRKKGKTFSLGTEYGSDDFIRRYEAALKAETVDRRQNIPGSFDALCEAYYRSTKYSKLGPSTRTTYRGIIERFRETRGEKMVKDLRRSDVMAIMSKMGDKPAAANSLLRMLRMLMKLAVQLEWRETDPTEGVDKYPTGPGHLTWTEDDIAKYLEVHRPGTMAHTAMVIMLYTGAARADVVRLGWGNVKNGRIKYRRQKMLSRDGILVDIPIHPELGTVIDQLPRTAFTFLQTANGKSRSPNGFGNLMRKWCREAGLENCSSHGLRKALARRLAEAGCTPHQIASITGHKSETEVARYTEAADRAGLADGGMKKIMANISTVSHFNPKKPND